jgi:general secretion pathway protein J
MIALRARHGTSDAGFTLLEALAATILMAMILAALTTITAQWLPNWNRGIIRVQGNDHIGLALERIVADLAAAELVTAADESRHVVFDGIDQSIVFVRTSLGPNALPSLDLVQIGVIEAESGSVVVRSRAPFLPATTRGATQRQPVFSDPAVLLRGSYRLGFSYAGEDRVWHPAWRARADLPMSIRVSLADSNAQRARLISTTVAGYAKAPVECLSAKSMTECHILRQGSASSEGGKAR